MTDVIVPLHKLAGLALLALKARGYLTAREIMDYLGLGGYLARRLLNEISRMANEEAICNTEFCITKNLIVDLGPVKIAKRTIHLPQSLDISPGKYWCLLDAENNPRPCTVYTTQRHNRQVLKRLYINAEGIHRVRIIKIPHDVDLMSYAPWHPLLSDFSPSA